MRWNAFWLAVYARFFGFFLSFFLSFFPFRALLCFESWDHDSTLLVAGLLGFWAPAGLEWCGCVRPAQQQHAYSFALFWRGLMSLALVWVYMVVG